MTSTISTDHQSIIDGFLADRLARHGDLRMEATDGTPPADEKPADDAPKDEAPPADEKPADDAKPDEKPEEKPSEDGDDWKMDDLPSSLQKHIRDLRAENANQRTRAKAAEQKLADAKTPEEVEAAVNEIRAENARLARELLVTTVAKEHELPDDLAALLQGDDKAALEASAKVLAKYATGSQEPGSLSGGLTPDDGEEFDPYTVAAQARKRPY